MGLSKAWLILAIGTMGFATPAFCQSPPAKVVLGSAEIKESLTSKLISYSPPGWADAGAHEEFHKDGRWGGIRYSRGPDHFSGRWSVETNQLCIVADKGSWVAKMHPGKYCRQVWKNTRTGQLLIAHISGFGELQALSVEDLKRWGEQ